ncbi:hypothetical protein PHLCEN_2v268, partial [Hermanssonia centrifuga]
AKFLFNNYKQVLHILKEFTPEVNHMKTLLGLEDNDIKKWARKEHKFLLDLKDEPEERVLESAYVEALIMREKADANWQKVSMDFVATEGHNVQDEVKTCRLETACCHAMHEMALALHAVKDLKLKLELNKIWTPKHPKYEETLAYMQKQQFH